MNRRLIIITGLSGSGKSTAARVIEDAGFFVVDNLPLVMLPEFLCHTDDNSEQVAVVVDARNRNFLKGSAQILENVRNEGYGVDIYFFDADDQELVRRFSETRRRHPLVQKEGISGAIREERSLMKPLRDQAAAVIDSTGLNVHQLRRKVLQVVFGEEREAQRLSLQLLSFGFRNGLPVEADLVFDVRFLANPHFVEDLRPLSGLDEAVSSYVLTQPKYQEFFLLLKQLLFFLIPNYEEEGKSSLTVGVGCTGGRHRSVAIVEDLRPHLLGSGASVDVAHRDLNKG